MLAPPEGLRSPGVPGVNPWVDPWSQGVIPRRFKRKKKFVSSTYGWTHRRVGGNSGLDSNPYFLLPHTLNSIGKYDPFLSSIL